MSAIAFLGRRLRRYTMWLLLAGFGALVFAAGTVALVSLFRPIFSEVLLSDQLPTEIAMLDREPATDSETCSAAGPSRSCSLSSPPGSG